jgi:hypothetical protein
VVSVTVNEARAETPTETVVKVANTTVTVKTADGRDITIKKVSTLDRMRLFELVGPENVKNEAYFGYAMLAYHVTAIDGEPVAKPGTKLQLEALVQRLDDAGMNAVGQAVLDNFLNSIQSPDDAREAVKNG